jgi:hypothetical protein
MTGSNASERAPETPAGAAGDDQQPVPVEYGHGRMPFFMKLAWTIFLAFGTYYVAVFLIPAAGEELAK